MRADNRNIGLLCLAYLAFQLCFISFTTLSVDDLWLSYHTYQFKSLLPYRDFSPYKTVLGYYILLLPLNFFHGVLAPLFYTKAFVALINTYFLAGIAVWMKRFFPIQAVLVSMALIIFSQVFSNYSTEIRVDIFSYWLCLISVLFIFENKFVLSGLSIGLAFAASQKALIYIIATDCALASYWLCYARSWQTVKNGVIFNIAAILPIIAYIVFWAHYSSLHTVLHNVFYEAYIIAASESYLNVRLSYWQFILSNNAAYFLLWPLAILSFFITTPNDKFFGKRVFITAYALVILASMMNYKQPFAYNMTVTFPAFFILFAAIFTWIFSIFKATSLKVNWIGETGAMSLIVLYAFALLNSLYVFELPAAYLLVLLIPIMIGIYLYTSKNAQTYLLLVLLVTLFTGVIYPVVRTTSLLPYLNGNYQKYIINLTAHLLADGSEYVAGEPLFYNKDQPVPGLKHLVVPELEYLYQPTQKLLPVVQLSSLYLSPVSNQDIIASLKNNAIKLYVNNNRLVQIPQVIKDYLDSQYQHYWGSIYLYAPQITAGKKSIKIRFAGRYLVESHQAIQLAGKLIQPYALIHLENKTYLSESNQLYRLRLLPENMQDRLNPKYKDDDWNDVLV